MPVDPVQEPSQGSGWDTQFVPRVRPDLPCVAESVAVLTGGEPAPPWTFVGICSHG